MRFRAKEEHWDIAMEEGDFIVVPAGVEHMTAADEECWIMIIASAGALNTGEAESERSKHNLPVL